MFYKIIVNSWDDAITLFNKISDDKSDWAYRGQADENWGLSTKFERDAKKYETDSYWFKNREAYIIRDFRRRAQNYVKNLPSPDDYIGWLSLLQHYGGPTRLLDFTYSIYVALFFATETSLSNSAIWAVNIQQLINQLSKVTDYNLVERERTFEKIISRTNHWAETIIKDRNNRSIVFPVEPFHLNERISIQQGIFLFPGDIEKTFESNICSVFEFGFNELSNSNASNLDISNINEIILSEISVIKIMIPSKLHSKSLVELHKMNVTAATLFPGLDGFARSLSFRFGQLDYALSKNYP
jgi:hypothetical protein